MDIEGFLTEVKTDPLNRGYSGMTRDELWTSLNTADRSVVDHTTPRVAELGVLKAFGTATGNPADGEACLVKLETAAEANSMLKRVLSWSKPGAPGLDLSDPLIRATLTALSPSVITADELAVLLGIAQKSVSRLTEIHGGNPAGYSDLDREYFNTLLDSNGLLTG